MLNFLRFSDEKNDNHLKTNTKNHEYAVFNSSLITVMFLAVLEISFLFFLTPSLSHNIIVDELFTHFIHMHVYVCARDMSRWISISNISSLAAICYNETNAKVVLYASIHDD